ncbi:MAG: acyl-CoA dehydrogenase, partial [Leptospiraceae bacterium]|nr:acyl-CoA dehydrogenase [Leptospiraceae bacterium]
QGATTKGQDKVQFGPWRKAYEPYAHLPNVSVFLQQSEQFRSFLNECGPDASQVKDLDFMLTVGEIFTLIAYGSLVLEQAAFDKIDADLIDSIFEFQVRDFSKHALNLYQKRSVNADQQTACQKMIQRAAIDTGRANRLHTIVMQYKDMYRMND